MLALPPASGTLRAVRIDRHGGPDVLQVVELPRRPLGSGEVRVAVSHVALNHLDLWVRRGVPGHDFHLPRIPGSDVSGVIVEGPGAGSGVALAPSWGCLVCPACMAGRHNRCAQFRIRGENADGGCATEVVVPAWMCLPRPASLSMAEAAATPLTLLTAWHMLIERARIERGERVLVQAGGSGVGIMAIQIARMMGCEVHATASTPERRARIEALGARAWPYEAVGARDGVRECAVVVESPGAETWEGSVRALGWGGRLVTCGATTGPQASVNLRVLFFKQQSLLGSTMGTQSDLTAAWRAVEAGLIRPVVDRVLPMTRLGEAHALLERREVFGKVVVEQDLAEPGARGG